MDESKNSVDDAKENSKCDSDKTNANSNSETPASEENQSTIILSQLKNFKHSPDEVTYARVKESLDSVEGLTQYEDAKAGRLLTAVGLFSALGGGLYSNLSKVPGLMGERWIHYLFFVFCFFIALSAFVLVSAIFPRFNIPDARKLLPGSGKRSGNVRSRLFAAEIGETMPAAWGRYFSETSNDKIQIDYYKDCIHESYLISEKILKKCS